MKQLAIPHMAEAGAIFKQKFRVAASTSKGLSK